MQRLSVGEGDFSVFIRGEGAVVLFIHGFPFDHAMYLPLCEELSQRYCCVIPDLPGFGGSCLLPSPPTMAAYADHLFQLLSALKITDKIVLYGLSMGGYIAMEFARKYSHRLNGLILSNTRTSADTPIVAANRLKLVESIHEAIRSHSYPSLITELAQGMIPNMLSSGTMAHSPETVDFVRQMIIRQPSEGVLAATLAMLSRQDTTEVLQSLTIPVQMICGSEDILSPPSVMKPLLALLQQGRYDEIPNTGHLTPLEATDYCRDIVLRLMMELN